MESWNRCELFTHSISQQHGHGLADCLYIFHHACGHFQGLEIIAGRRVVCPLALLVQAAMTAFLGCFGHHGIGSIQVKDGVALVRFPKVIHVKPASIVEKDHDCQKSGDDLDGKWQNNETDS
mmetsp:Transcript_58738/g.128583  ORF Transcript_58738/g.128583 Transcript_58738/m.128583 type:complete len:122 (-) Transcript_58738:1102-1467(-)